MLGFPVSDTASASPAPAGEAFGRWPTELNAVATVLTYRPKPPTSVSGLPRVLCSSENLSANTSGWMTSGSTSSGPGAELMARCGTPASISAPTSTAPT